MAVSLNDWPDLPPTRGVQGLPFLSPSSTLVIPFPSEAIGEALFDLVWGTGSYYVAPAAWNSRSSCLRFSSAGIMGVHHHTQLFGVFVLFNGFLYNHLLLL